MITLTLVILLYSFTSVIALSRLRQTIPQVSYYAGIPQRLLLQLQGVIAKQRLQLRLQYIVYRGTVTFRPYRLQLSHNRTTCRLGRSPSARVENYKQIASALKKES